MENNEGKAATNSSCGATSECGDRPSSEILIRDIAPPHVDYAPDVAWSQDGMLDVDGLIAAYGSVATAESLTILRELRAHEPGITKAIVNAALSAGATAAGLEHRVKSPQSLARKTQSRMIVNPRADKPICDSLRYTIQAPRHDDVVPCARFVVAALADLGFSVESAEQSYVSGNPYKGVHMVVLSPRGGILSEVQFQSARSLQLKRVNHMDYEVSRDESRPRSERLAADERMRERYSAMRAPAGLRTLTSLGGVNVEKKIYR